MMILLLTVLAAEASANVAAAAPPSPSPDFAVLRAADQALLDAIAPGNRALWARTLTTDAVYVDENGAVLDRDQFLKSLDPLPAGISGHIAIIDYDARIHGDTALVRHRDDEREVYHGQALHAQYLMTETWLRQDGAWRLALAHAYVVAVDPPAITLPASTLDSYVGVYAMADLTYQIRKDGDHLVGARAGRPFETLLAETPDVLFVAGRPRTRIIFQRDQSGRIARFIDRREGEDLVWLARR